MLRQVRRLATVLKRDIDHGVYSGRLRLHCTNVILFEEFAGDHIHIQAWDKVQKGPLAISSREVRFSPGIFLVSVAKYTSMSDLQSIVASISLVRSSRQISNLRYVDCW